MNSKEEFEEFTGREDTPTTLLKAIYTFANPIYSWSAEDGSSSIRARGLASIFPFSAVIRSQTSLTTLVEREIGIREYKMRVIAHLINADMLDDICSSDTGEQILTWLFNVTEWPEVRIVGSGKDKFPARYKDEGMHAVFADSKVLKCVTSRESGIIKMYGVYFMNLNDSIVYQLLLKQRAKWWTRLEPIALRVIPQGRDLDILFEPYMEVQESPDFGEQLENILVGMINSALITEVEVPF